MNVVWENVSINNYLHSANSEENQITVIWKWKSKFFKDTKARKCIIDLAGKWYSIHMSDSFVPRYKDGKDPMDPDAEIFTLSEYYPKATSEEKCKGAEVVNNTFSILQITTAYDTVSKTRLITDGLKRSLRIMDKIKKGQEFRPVTILECYGHSVKQIFFIDFPYVLKKIR
jgi:hypothetical protein